MRFLSLFVKKSYFLFPAHIRKLADCGLEKKEKGGD